MPTKHIRAAAKPERAISAAGLAGVRVLFLVALGVSLYLAWVSLSQGQAVGCGPDSSCDKVLQSRWSKWFDVPVSLLAAGLDAFVLGWSFALGPARAPAAQRRAWAWVVSCVVLVVGAAVWFVALQLFVVHAICPYCMLAHGSGFAGAVLLLVAAPLRPAPSTPEAMRREVYLTASSCQKGMALALGVLAALVTGQVVHPSKTYTVTSMSGSTNALPPPPALFTRLHPVYGRFQLPLQQVPLLGSPTNEQVMVSLFDYTCHHCRAMHPLLVEAQQLFSNRLVIATLPMPLDPYCNPTMQRAHPMHSNACAYARLSLAVWRADPAKYHAFDDWLMTGERPPPWTEAQAKAIGLVGSNRFEKASQDPWVEDQLRMDVAIYEVAYRAGHGSMPQLILGSQVAEGTYPREDLLRLLDQNLGLKAGP